ncbi:MULTISPECIES: amidohydrolase family protein [Sphingobium]|uniref:amidohydrolase family protein n=1 Tax=Sphingobium TaxID=165695 RepID=UPI00159C14BC|nr:amidohydrolase family protein [Sphingobium sp. 15-1]
MLEAYDYKHVIDIGFPCDRTPEDRKSRRLPAGMTIVAPDNHWSLSEDIFIDRFPEHLKDRAPHVWQSNGTWHVGFNGKSLLPEFYEKIFATFDVVPGCFDMNARLHDLNIEGIEKEMVFPNGFFAAVFYPDFEVREWMLRIYNEYVAELQAKSNGRFFGVGFPAFWDVGKFVESVQHIKQLGLKSIVLPNNPGKNPQGKEIVYQDDDMQPCWAAIEEAGLPVNFHIGESFADGRGGYPISTMLNFAGLRKPLSQLIFGGIFDRHPSLQVAFQEAGILWAASCLHDAEIAYASQARISDWKLAHPPRHYWQNHCYVSFMSDPLGLKIIDSVGVDRVMWTPDYPHPEGTLGYGWKAIQDVIDALGEENAAKVLGRTAQKLFNF